MWRIRRELTEPKLQYNWYFIVQSFLKMYIYCRHSGNVPTDLYWGKGLDISTYFLAWIAGWGDAGV